MKLKMNIYTSLILSLLLLSISINAQNKNIGSIEFLNDCGISNNSSISSISAAIFEDRMNGDNSLTGLQSRNWVVINQDGGGDSDPWFMGDNTVFNSFEGPSNGFVASNFSGANASGVVNHWLISPLINASENDTLSFWFRSPESSQFDDSISIYLALDGGSTISSFSINYVNANDNNNPRWLVPKNNWTNWQGLIPQTGNIRFAIQYYLEDADANGDYIGIDLIQVLSTGGGTTYPQNITLSTTQGFGDPNQSSSFRMIGLPGNINTSMSQFLGGNSGTDWVAFYDNGAATDYLVGYSSTGTFNFTPGKGFWILSKNNFSVSQQVNTVTLAGDNSYSIPLHNGWNIISNPFEINVSWASVRAANSITENLHDFNGSYTLAPNMVPYKGYYYFNAVNAPNLKIPYAQSVIAKSTNPVDKKSLKISLVASGITKSIIEIGFDENSKNSYDELDKFSPPGDFDEYKLSITNKSLETPYKYLMSDFRKEIENGKIFDVTIKTKSTEKVVLQIDGADNFADFNLLLIGETNSKVYDLNKSSEIEIVQNSKSSNYKLVIGTDEFVENIQSDLIPEEFSLVQNFPNPFNPETIINYSITKNSFVSLKVFDVLGNEVSKLVDEIKSAGHHDVKFRGEQLSSGIYFYRLETSEFVQTKKMILLK